MGGGERPIAMLTFLALLSLFRGRTTVRSGNELGSCLVVVKNLQFVYVLFARKSSG